MSFKRYPGLFGAVLLAALLMLEMTVASADQLFDFQIKLAKQGSAEAEYKIGEMYKTGFGAPKNMKLAKEWITKAAKQGHEAAGFQLLYWDMEKNGITKSNKAQYQQLVKKAESNDEYAQLYLGKVYAAGAGVPVNRQKALDLFNKATLQGSDEAERDASALREKMRQENIAKKKQEEELKRKKAEQRKQQEEAARIAAQKAAAAAAAKQVAASKRKQNAVSQKQAAALKAEQQADAKKKAAAQAAEQRALEARRQALLKQRQQQEAQRKDQFDADPCTGKSARFLSTCH